jgi:hypothetical protein
MQEPNDKEPTARVLYKNKILHFTTHAYCSSPTITMRTSSTIDVFANYIANDIALTEYLLQGLSYYFRFGPDLCVSTRLKHVVSTVVRMPHACNEVRQRSQTRHPT